MKEEDGESTNLMEIRIEQNELSVNNNNNNNNNNKKNERRRRWEHKLDGSSKEIKTEQNEQRDREWGSVGQQQQ